MAYLDVTPGALTQFDCAPGNRDVSDEDKLERLIKALVLKDELALADIYQLLGSRVYRYCLRIVGDTASAEELVVDVLWQIWRQADCFDETRGTVSTWVLMISRSRSLELIRRRSRTATALTRVDTAPGDLDDHWANLVLREAADCDQPQPGWRLATDPLEILENAQQNSRLWSLMEQLRPPERHAVVLAFFHGLTHLEVARHTGAPLGTVKTHIRRALLVLRTWLDKPENSGIRPHGCSAACLRSPNPVVDSSGTPLPAPGLANRESSRPLFDS